MGDELDRAIDDVILGPSARFEFFSGILKAFEEDGRFLLRGTASSTVTDLHGDEMTKTALEDMEHDANNNLTIFLNHKYDVPEDVAGSVTTAKMARRKSEDGSLVWDLDYEIELEDENERAMKTYRSIKGKGTGRPGRKLGLSIGAMIPEDGAKRRKDGSYLIEHVKLLETSIVGIPANPRSFVQNAIKSLDTTKAATEIQLSTPKLTLDPETRMYRIEGSLSDVNFETKSTEPEEGELQAIVTVNDDGNLEVSAPDTSPDVQDAKVTVIEIDTGPSNSETNSDSGASQPPASDSASQEAPGAAPDAEAGLADETAEGDDEALGDDLTRSIPDDLPPAVGAVLMQALTALNQTAARLVEVETQLSAERELRATAERERDAVRDGATRLMRDVSEVIKKIASTPLKSRTSFVQAQNQFAHLTDIYGEGFVKQLQEMNNG